MYAVILQECTVDAGLPLLSSVVGYTATPTECAVHNGVTQCRISTDPCSMHDVHITNITVLLCQRMTHCYDKGSVISWQSLIGQVCQNWVELCS